MVLDLLKSQLWWILQITGSLGIYFALASGRIYGLCWRSYFTYVAIGTTTASWMFLKSYQLAPSFFQAWFVGTASLAIIGFIGSMFYFKESPTALGYFGALISLIGMCMLAWPQK
jgi:drug/metabolite transporter (DMT)-like permease